MILEGRAVSQARSFNSSGDPAINTRSEASADDGGAFLDRSGTKQDARACVVAERETLVSYPR